MTETLKALPDLALSMKYLQLSMLLPGIHHQSVVAHAWRNGPVKEVAREIWEQIQDNPNMVYGIVGRAVYEMVEKIFTQHKP